MPLGTSNVNINQDLIEKSAFCLQQLRLRGLRLGLAESCTGGLVTFLFCMHPGASFVVECGLVTYSENAKRQLLGVKAEDLVNYSAVSVAVAESMADGLLARRKDIDMALSITGIAGNSRAEGENEDNVGQVIISKAERTRKTITRELQLGNLKRNEIQCKAAAEALDIICSGL